MDAFWSKVMPAAIANYSWAGDFGPETTEEAWKKGLAKRIKSMDESEFDLFLAGVVMNSAREQMMGVDLTEKINYFRSLRK